MALQARDAAMQTTYEATIWGIKAGINTSVLEKRTLSWLERKPGNRRRSRVTRTFYKLACYGQTDNLLAIPGVYYYDTEVDGRRIIEFGYNEQCVGVWYCGRNVGTVCMQFHGDSLHYYERDPFRPWHD
jgi:hypothetical protein